MLHEDDGECKYENAIPTLICSISTKFRIKVTAVVTKYGHSQGKQNGKPPQLVLEQNAEHYVKRLS